MKWFIRILVLLLLSPLVFALGEKTFNWEPPTEREDATPLDNADIQEYRIYCDGDLTTPIHVQPNEPLNTDTWQAPAETFALGTHDCVATAVDTGGKESLVSNTVNFTVSLARPKAPIFAVQ